MFEKRTNALTNRPELMGDCHDQSADWSRNDSSNKHINNNLFGSRIFQSIVIPASCALVECGQGEGMLKHTNFFILSR